MGLSFDWPMGLVIFILRAHIIGCIQPVIRKKIKTNMWENERKILDRSYHVNFVWIYRITTYPHKVKKENESSNGLWWCLLVEKFLFMEQLSCHISNVGSQPIVWFRNRWQSQIHWKKHIQYPDQGHWHGNWTRVARSKWENFKFKTNEEENQYLISSSIFEKANLNK